MNKEDAIAVIRGLLSSTKSSYSVYSLNKDFYKETGVNIPAFGFQSFIDFLQSIPQIVEVTGIFPAQQVRLVTLGKSGHIVSLVQRQKSSSSRYLKMKNLYISKKYFKNDLTSDNSFYESPLSQKCDEDKMENGKIEYSTTESITNEGCTSSGSYQDSIVSEDVPRYCDKILPMNFSRHAKVGQYIEVYVSHINHPHEFYFQLRKNKKKLFKLMKELDLFYNDHTESFTLPEDAIKQGQICAAFYSNMWHRAEILFKLNDSEVVVKSVDHGTTGKVLKTNLRFLHNDFGFLCRQAVLGSLANIMFQKDGICWTGSATQRFYELAYEKDLIAGVVEIKKEVPWVNLALTLTVGKEVHINDTLVKESFVNFITDDSVFDSSNSKSVRIATSQSGEPTEANSFEQK